MNNESHRQFLNRILMLIVDLGRVNVRLDASIITSCVDFTREVHLEKIYRVLAHIKNFHNGHVAFDLSEPSTKNADIERKDWSCTEFSSIIERKLELLHKTATPRGIGFVIVEK